MLKKAFDFFVFSNLFIAVCAVAMVWQSYYVFHLLFFNSVIGFVFFGTLCSYNFHWYLTPTIKSSSLKVQWAIANRKLHFIFFVIGAVGAAYFLYQLRQYWFWLFITAFVTFLYSAPKVPHHPFVQLRKIAIAKTLFLAFVWMHITTVLPMLISGVILHTPHYLFAFNRFFFIYPVCILFDLRDKEQDKTEGIKSIITVFNEQSIDIIFWGCLVVCLITGILYYFYTFSLSTLLAQLLAVLVLALLHQPAKKSFSDYLYYFVLDGLLMFSALLQFIFQF